MTTVNRIFEMLEQEQVTEKLITFGDAGNYGNIVFMAGGAGSGKGYAVKNFIDFTKFKVRDVDEWKRLFLRIDELKGLYPEIRGLNLKNPDDVLALHDFVDNLDVKDKTLVNMLAGLKDPSKLPNVLFDLTAKSSKQLLKVTPQLIDVGYEPRKIHLVWVLTNFKVAWDRNLSRSRVVPRDIFLQTHYGASVTMFDQIYKGNLDTSIINGGVYVILNNEDQTVFYDRKSTGISADLKDAGIAGKTKQTKVIKDFSYLTLKKPGKPFINERGVQEQLYDWIMKNVPQETEQPLR